MFWLIWTVIVGLIVGVIAKAIMPGEDPGGVIMTILLGIGGAFVGRILAGFLGIWGYSGLAGLLFSVIGAVVILWLYRKFFRKDEVVV